MTDLIALREQVRGLSGADAVTDRMLLLHFDPEHPGAKRYPDSYKIEWRDGGFSVWSDNFSSSTPYPRFTASVDAALAFAERVLPGWKIHLFGSFTEGVVDLHGSHRVSSGAHARPWPIAIILAVLEALITQGSTHDHE